MLGPDGLAPGKIGNGARDLADAVIAAGGETECVKGLPHQLRAGIVQIAELTQLRRLHIRIAAALAAGEALTLDGACGLNACFHGARRFRLGVTAQIIEVQ